MEQNCRQVTVDRKMGTAPSPHFPELVYPVNYGYIEGVLTPGGEEQDAYILGVSVPVETFTGRVIAVIHRDDDAEEKWVVAPDGMAFSEERSAKKPPFRNASSILIF